MGTAFSAFLDRAPYLHLEPRRDVFIFSTRLDQREHKVMLSVFGITEDEHGFLALS